MRSGEARKKFPNNSVNNVITLATRVRIQLLKVNVYFRFNFDFNFFLTRVMLKCHFVSVSFHEMSNVCHLGGFSFVV